MTSIRSQDFKFKNSHHTVLQLKNSARPGFAGNSNTQKSTQATSTDPEMNDIPLMLKQSIQNGFRQVVTLSLLNVGAWGSFLAGIFVPPLLMVGISLLLVSFANGFARPTDPERRSESPPS